MKLLSLIVLFLIFLPSVFAEESSQALEESTETSENLLRLICEKNNSRVWEKVFPARVLILEQSTNHQHKFYGTVINGSDLISINSNVHKMKVRARLSIYNATLTSSEKTEEQIIDELLSRGPDLSFDGFIHRDRSVIIFTDSFRPEYESTHITMPIFLDNYHFTSTVQEIAEKIMEISRLNSDVDSSDLTDFYYHYLKLELGIPRLNDWGRLSINKWSNLFESGEYICKDLTLINI